MGVTAERLQVEVGADTSEAERKLGDLGNDRGGAKWTSALKTAGVAAFAAVGAAGVAVVGTGLKVAADMEQADIAFTTMLGSGEKAKVFLDQLKAFAAETPFEFPELQTAASSLISAGFEASKVIPIMTTLGDVTSGMGTGAEGVQRATVALQQMSAAGKITGEDLNQLRDAGVPVFDLLAAATGKSKDEIAALAQAGKLGKKEMEALFTALESGKGLEKFNGLMQKQSQSLIGLLSTLKDTVGQTLAGLMTPVVGQLKNALPQITDVIDKALKTVGPQLGGLASGLIGALTSILPSLVPILGAVAQTIGKVFSQLAPVVEQLMPAFLRVIEALLPVLPELANVVVALSPALVVMANAFAAILETIPTPVLTALVVAFVGLTQVILPLVPLIGALAAAFAVGGAAGLGGALVALIGPIGLVVAAIAALAAIAYVIIHNWEPIKGFFVALWGGIQAVFQGAVDIIKGLVDNWFRVLLAVFTGGTSELLGFIVRNWSDIKSAVAGGISAVVGFVTGLFPKLVAVVVAGATAYIGFWLALPGRTIAAMANLPGLLYNLGRDMMLGMIHGVEAMAGALIGAAKRVVGGAINAAKSLLGIGSPSRLFFGFGGNTMQGFINGMLGQSRDVERAAMRALSPLTGMGPTLGGGIGANALGAGVGRASAAVSDAVNRTTIVVQGSIWSVTELFEELRARGIDLEFLNAGTG